MTETSLVPYTPASPQTLRATRFLVQGHRFEQETGWTCRCGLQYPWGALASEIERCRLG